MGSPVAPTASMAEDAAPRGRIHISFRMSHMGASPERPAYHFRHRALFPKVACDERPLQRGFRFESGSEASQSRGRPASQYVPKAPLPPGQEPSFEIQKDP